jgi:hypothetical protein
MVAVVAVAGFVLGHGVDRHGGGAKFEHGSGTAAAWTAFD